MSKSDTVNISIDTLKTKLDELRTVIEDTDLMSNGATFSMRQSSLYIPKDSDWYFREIMLNIRRHLIVSVPPSVESPSSQFHQESKLTMQLEYTEKNLPLILYQFHSDRIHDITRLKYYHLLRWNRFCLGSMQSDELYSAFTDTLKSLTDEYLDAASRAERLNAAREGIFMETKSIPDIFQPNDVIILVRHMVYQKYAHRNFRQIYFLLKWLPFAHKEFAKIECATMSFANLWSLSQMYCIGQDLSKRTVLDDILKLDNSTCQLPVFATNPSQFMPLLKVLCNQFNIDLVAEENPMARDFNLHDQVEAKFRELYAEISKWHKLVTYGYENAGEQDEVIYRKPAIWLEFRRLKPKPNTDYTHMITLMDSELQVDELLQGCNALLHMNDMQQVLQVLHKQIDASTGAKPNTSCADFDEGLSKIQHISVKPPNGQDVFDTMQDQDLADSRNADISALLPFLEIRFLRVKVLRKQSLQILNYFRSLEKTLTMDDQGLNMVSSKQQFHTDSHPSYLFDSVIDAKISESEFMEFAETINRDDYYFQSESGQEIFVRDVEGGKVIVYDAAESDFQRLEKELLQIASYFLLKGQDSEKKLPKRLMDNESEIKMNSVAFAQMHVDRHGVLYDIWTAQTAFLQAKKELMQIYMEVYLNVICRRAKKQLAQVMVNLMYLCPKLNYTSSDYFFREFRLNIACLEQRIHLMKKILTQHVSEQREYLNILQLDQENPKFGLPRHSLRSPNLIATHIDRALIKPVKYFEFFPTMSFVGYLAEAIDTSISNLFDLRNPQTATEELRLETLLLQMLSLELQNLTPIGNSYAQVLEKDLFSGIIIDNAATMSEHMEQLLDKVQGAKVVEKALPLLNAISLRSRLMDDLWESEIMNKIYLFICASYKLPESHLFIAPRVFENAKITEKIDRPRIRKSCDEESLEKFVPNHLHLAATDVDDSITKFSFRNRATIVEACEPAGINNLQNTRKLQLTHKNLLMAALLLAMRIEAKPCHLDEEVLPTIPFLSVQLEKKMAREYAHNHFLQHLPPGGVTALAKNVQKYTAHK
ncbi:hypothetical protein Ciccas_007705, partial [Cichlidogyrus casuarinus]